MAQSGYFFPLSRSVVHWDRRKSPARKMEDGVALSIAAPEVSRSPEAADRPAIEPIPYTQGNISRSWRSSKTAGSSHRDLQRPQLLAVYTGRYRRGYCIRRDFIPCMIPHDHLAWPVTLGDTARDTVSPSVSSHCARHFSREFKRLRSFPRASSVPDYNTMTRPAVQPQSFVHLFHLWFEIDLMDGLTSGQLHRGQSLHRGG